VYKVFYGIEVFKGIDFDVVMWEVVCVWLYLFTVLVDGFKYGYEIICDFEDCFGGMYFLSRVIYVRWFLIFSIFVCVFFCSVCSMRRLRVIMVWLLRCLVFYLMRFDLSWWWGLVVVCGCLMLLILCDGDCLLVCWGVVLWLGWFVVVWLLYVDDGFWLVVVKWVVCCECDGWWVECDSVSEGVDFW